MVGSWYSTVSSSMINNVNVFNNTAYGNAFGAVLNPATSILWENNIFANNKTAGVYNENSSITGHSFNYNLFYSNGPNTWYNVAHYNDVSANPLFTNPSTGDFSLQSTSPAINVGDPNTTTTVCGTVDFLGNPRIVGGRIDMAAYEYPAGSAPGAPTNLTATVN